TALLSQLVVDQFQPYAAQKIKVLQANVARDKVELADVNARLRAAENQPTALAKTGPASQIVTSYNFIISAAADQRLGLQNDESSSLQQIAAAQNIEQARCVPS